MEDNSKLLVVQVNGVPMLEYNREKLLSNAQIDSLKLIEKKLNEGFNLGGHNIDDPKLEQKIEFVTANLVSALLNDDEVLSAASCAYVAQVLPELKQIKAVEKNGEISIELVFDRAYQTEEKLIFTPIDKITSKHH